MGDLQRRDVVRLLALAPAATAFSWTSADVLRASRLVSGHKTRGGQQFEPQFFTLHEYETVRVLVDLLIPRDTRSGSATDAGVPAFIDFMMIDRPENQIRMRGGLAWLDAECADRFEATFLACTDEQRRAVLDDIAWPARAPAQLSHGVAFFNSFRDLTATGFWSSKMGVEDLQYLGNTVVPEWTGCPDEQLRRLRVSYD